MISVGSLVKVTDNSGARIGRCIKVYGKTRHGCAYVGDIILVTIRKIVPFEKQRAKFHIKRKLSKSEMFKAVVVRTKKRTNRCYGNFGYLDNAVILLKSEDTLFANRVYGPVSFELRSKWSKIIMASGGVI